MCKCGLVITLVAIVTLFNSGVWAAVADIHVGNGGY